MTKNNILIVGTGLAGCTCARLLAQKNYKITIIDKNNFVGGNCYDYLSDDGSCYIHKFGPHIFHTQNKEVWDFVNKFSQFNHYRHMYFCQYNNQNYVFPINLNTISKLYNTLVYSKEQAEKLIHDKCFQNPKNFQQAAINSIGTKLYEAFIKNYTKKQWQCDPKELPVEIFKRINIRYNFNDETFQGQYQGMPINGYTNMIQNMLNHQNIIIKLNIQFDQNMCKNYDKVIYTGGFKGLPYRSTKFQHYMDSTSKISVLNLPNDPIATRITNFNVLHKINESNIHNFCKEIPAKNNQYNELYPIRNQINLKLYNQKKQQLLLKHPNIILCGRLATYEYLDMDKAISQAINIIKKISNDIVF